MNNIYFYRTARKHLRKNDNGQKIDTNKPSTRYESNEKIIYYIIN